jgi:uncharacterized LabA/DUF88 family protein
MSIRPRPWRALSRLAGRIPHVSTLRARSLRKRIRHRRKSVIVYIDGFNLYRNLIQNHPSAKWVDLFRMCELLMPGFEITRVRYFTAKIHALEGTDPRAPSRQATYLRALENHPRIDVHYGKFLQVKRSMEVHPIQRNPDGSLMKTRVRKIEEKQSDVNLAAHMVRDASENRADVYMLLSCDSDFAGLMELLITDMGKVVGMISPIDSYTGELRSKNPRYFRKIRPGVLHDSQFPETITVGRSTLNRPEKWSRGPVEDEAPRPVAEASGDVPPK